MVTVNIHGSCVTRDSFELYKESFKVNTYISRNSIFSAVCSPVELDKKSFRCSPPYLARMVVCDFEKRLFKLLSEKRSDYLIIDLIDERFPLLKFFDNNNSTVTFSSNFRKSNILTDHPVYSIYNYEIINTIKLDSDYVDSAINQYCSNILKIYNSDQIIINESYLVGHYVDEDGSIKCFNEKRLIEYKEINKKIHKLYRKLIENLNIPCKNVIKMPNPTFADNNNKWGLAP